MNDGEWLEIGRLRFGLVCHSFVSVWNWTHETPVNQDEPHTSPTHKLCLGMPDCHSFCFDVELDSRDARQPSLESHTSPTHTQCLGMPDSHSFCFDVGLVARDAQASSPTLSIPRQARHSTSVAVARCCLFDQWVLFIVLLRQGGIALDGLYNKPCTVYTQRSPFLQSSYFEQG
jgi:hypothetical protein